MSGKELCRKRIQRESKVFYTGHGSNERYLLKGWTIAILVNRREKRDNGISVTVFETLLMASMHLR